MRRTCAARETCGVCARPDSTPLHPGPSPAGRLRWDPEEERHRLPRQSTWHSQETRAGVAEAPCFFQRQVLKAGTGWHCCAPDGRSGGASGRGQGGGTGAQFCSARSGVAWRSGPRSDAASRVRVKDPESGESNRARPNLDPCSHAPAGRVAEKTRRAAPPALHGPHCACAERPRWGFVISFRRQSPLKCEGKGLTWGPPMSLLHRSSSAPLLPPINSQLVAFVPPRCPLPPSLTLVFQSVLENSPFLHISLGKLVGNQSAEEFPPLHSEPGRDRSPHGQVCPARQRQGHRLLRASQATGSPAGGLCQPRRRLFPKRCGLWAAVPSHPWGPKAFTGQYRRALSPL